MAKQNVNNQRYLLIVGVLLILGIFLYMLRSVLLPFVVGIVIAYFLDPLVNKLTYKNKFSRSWTSVLVLGAFLLIFLPLLVLLGGIAVSQIVKFAVSFPEYLDTFKTKIMHYLALLQAYFPALTIDSFDGNMSESWKPVVLLIKKVIANGFAFINVMSLLLISPIVAFYMLRDWHGFTAKIFDLIPNKHKKNVSDAIFEVNRIISGYLRGQLLVCIALGSFYSCGLWLINLELGLLVGFIAGVISFIPYVGSISGFLMAMVLVITQYGTWSKIIEVVAVFALGQFIEGNFLTPKLVGENIGLHPVWVMFSLLAGGVLLGLLGMIIAVPLAACIGVLLRYLINAYKKSSLYLAN